MILYEFEGKKLLKDAGIAVPEGEVIEKESLGALNFKSEDGVVIKAQVLSGKRAAVGGVIITNGKIEGIDESLKLLFQKTINQEKVNKILVEEKIKFSEEWYLSLSYDTDFRSPVLSVSQSGGVGIEDRGATKYEINPLNPGENLPNILDSDLLNKLITLFFDQDLLLLEINPLVKTEKGWMALDCKIKLDDDASFRHPEWNFPTRGVPGKFPTKNEIDAKKIDQGDYRGVAGSTYFDLDGDIAVLSSGGGVSLTAMDALIKFDGKPANFTEYSGNPPKEKVTKLTRIVLDKPNIHGLWVIGTVAANFTDIHETLTGLIEGLRQAQTELDTKFNFPIIIRRGGPREKEAFEMLKEIKDFNLILQGEEVSITESAKVMAEKAREYATK